MKNLKLLSLFAFLLITLSVKAQDNSSEESLHTHPMWIGGGFGLNSLADQGFEHTIKPNFGLMVGEKIGAGIELIYSGGNNASSLTLLPYFRYYMHITRNFSFFGDAFLSYTSFDNDTTDNNDPSKFMGIGARAGIQYWFTSRWSVAAASNLVQFTSSNINGNKDTDFGLGVDFTDISLSFFFHF
jgi:uncharacterized protein YfiM (DUF2279 family)